MWNLKFVTNFTVRYIHIYWGYFVNEVTYSRHSNIASRYTDTVNNDLKFLDVEFNQGYCAPNAKRKMYLLDLMSVIFFNSFVFLPIAYFKLNFCSSILRTSIDPKKATLITYVNYNLFNFLFES